MIDVDLVDGPTEPVVRALAACLASVTETPLADLPDVGGMPVEHAPGAWKGSTRASGCSAGPSRVMAPVARVVAAGPST